MLYLDLTELPKVFAGRWLWSTERPALALAAPRRLPRRSTRAARRERSPARCSRDGARPAGPIRLLTHLRYFGYGFNPVSFYYCFDSGGTAVETIVAEVSNTPWGERHCYVLDGRVGTRGGGSRRRKPCTSRRSCRWTWRMTGRSRRPTRRLGVTMTMRARRSQRCSRRRSTCAAARSRAAGSRALLVRYPLMTAQVIAGDLLAGAQAQAAAAAARTRIPTNCLAEVVMSLELAHRWRRTPCRRNPVGSTVSRGARCSAASSASPPAAFGFGTGAASGLRRRGRKCRACGHGRAFTTRAPTARWPSAARSARRRRTCRATGRAAI